MTEKIIQFGEGNFLRGFADWIVQLVNETSDFDGGVVAVQPLKDGMCDCLEAQGCKYTHVMSGLSGGVPTVEKKFIDCITRTVQPYRDFDGYLALAQNPDFRFVISNTTESGIEFVKDDLPQNAPDISFPAKLTLLLKERFDAGYKGFIFLPCELIENNGQELKRCILGYARLWNLGGGFEKWINDENTFCNTLVDRIVTGHPKDGGCDEKMLDTSELFHLWVIEGPQSIKREFPFENAGVNIILTDNLEKYRTRKVRILNGAHTAMIPYAMLMGVETVGDCMKNDDIREFVKSAVYDEIIPTLDLSKDELTSYADSVFERFENPYIEHRCASIALNSVSKFKVRVLPSILEYIRRFGKEPERLMFSFAKLIEFYRTDMADDAPEICGFMKNSALADILSAEGIWQTDLSFLREGIEKYIEK